MAVTTVSLAFAGSDGSRNLDGTKSYNAVYIVDTDNARDQAAVVCDHFKNAGNLPYLGNTYSYANDYDAGASCKSITPKRADKSQTRWEVTLVYEVPSSKKKDDEQPDENGNPSKDPTEWIPRIDVSHTPLQVPVEKATYRGGYLSLVDAMCQNYKGPIINSAMMPFVPQPEKDLYITVVRRQWWDTIFNEDTEARPFIGKVNDQPYTGKPFGYSFSWAAFTAKIINIGGSLEFVNGESYWHKSVEIHVHPISWRKEYADRGLHAICMNGEPDGRGGTITGQTFNTAVGAVRQIRGFDDQIITEPVLLNGQGRPLVVGGSPPITIFSTWSIDDEITFPPQIMGI